MYRAFIFFSLLLGSVAYCRAQSDSAAMANQIIILEQQLADALPGDSALWDKYLDPKWHLVDEDGHGVFKQEFIKGFKPFPKAVSGKVLVTNPVVLFHGDVAVIQYTADEHETYYGQQLHTSYGTMDAWYKTDTSWIMLSMEDFEIPAWPPSIKVGLETLKLYTGTYRLSAENTATVTIKGDTLFIQKNKRQPEALLPEAENIFFRKSDARGRKFFVKNEVGQMELVERRNGQDVVWKREQQ